MNRLAAKNAGGGQRDIMEAISSMDIDKLILSLKGKG
jgi:hypothetical protein